MKFFILLIIVTIPFFGYAQKNKIIVLDEGNKKPINGVAVFTEMGSIIGNTNENGEFNYDNSLYAALNVKKLMFYDNKYQPIEIPISKLPNVIYLEKVKVNRLEDVEIKAQYLNRNFMLKAYVRSWKLINDKLVRFGDAIIEYEIPFDGSKYTFRAQKAKYINAYRNFRIDSIKAKSRIVSISTNDGFFSNDLPKTDRVSNSWYSMKKVNDSLSNVYDEGKNVGYAILGKNELPIEINITDNFEGEEAIKIALWWKISGKSKYIQKWVGDGKIRRPSYLFTNKKILDDTKGKGVTNKIETVTEIFLDEKINYTDIKPIKFKTSIDIDRCFYNTPYWIEEFKRHPLPSFILEQLINVNEVENTY